MHSDNGLSAENQQERLKQMKEIGWIVGFVDGEGCFSINFVRQPTRHELTRIRRGYRSGYQVSHAFAVVQGARSLESLQRLKEFFGVGGIYVNRRHDNHKENLYRYSVTKRDDLLRVIVPFFKEHALKTAKKDDFGHFVECLRLIQLGEHLTKDGVIRIAEITEQMNHKKSRVHLFENPQKPYANILQ